MCYVMIKPGVSADCKVWKEAAISRNYSPHVSVSGRVEGRGRKPPSTELVSGIHLTPPAHRSLWSALVTNLQSAAFWNPSTIRCRWSSSISGSPARSEGGLGCLLNVRLSVIGSVGAEAGWFSSMQITPRLPPSSSWRDALAYWQVRRSGR